MALKTSQMQTNFPKFWQNYSDIFPNKNNLTKGEYKKALEEITKEELVSESKILEQNFITKGKK